MVEDTSSSRTAPAWPCAGGVAAMAKYTDGNGAKGHMQTQLFLTDTWETVGIGASVSPCERYRYSLWKRWSMAPLVLFIGLNPSTASATTDDPTIRRCINYAKAWKHGGLLMSNAFAWRSTDPRQLYAQEDPVGPENDAALWRMMRSTECIVCGLGKSWGLSSTALYACQHDIPGITAVPGITTR